ncbi:unnamed protein product [marine sediment metagenome]|uniref:Uncharacterized protein n=1 Tax=marine sediment metagenome TaxID=412755 RepID=X0YWM3_9ZZZZ
MDNLIFTCSDALDQAATPACGVDYGERVVRIALMKDGGTFTVSASDFPTAAEFETAISGGEITIINGVTNGHRIEQGATELSGDDTETGGTERYDVEYRVEGRIKRIDETLARMTEKLDRYSTMRLWYFTEKDYCFGGVTGYLVAPNFSLITTEGKGQPPYISFFCDFTAIGADYAGYDDDYTVLDNTA